MITRILILSLTLVGCAHLDAARHGDAAITTDDLIQVSLAAERSGDTARAQQYLTLALQAGADESLHVPRLLALYIADGQYRVAIDRGEHHLRRHPDDGRTRLLLSTLYSAVGEYTDAARQYQRVLEAQPEHAYAHFALASLLHEQGGASERADEHFRRYLALDPHGEHAAEARGLLLRAVP